MRAPRRMSECSLPPPTNEDRGTRPRAALLGAQPARQRAFACQPQLPPFAGPHLLMLMTTWHALHLASQHATSTHTCPRCQPVQADPCPPRASSSSTGRCRAQSARPPRVPLPLAMRPRGANAGAAAFHPRPAPTCCVHNTSPCAAAHPHAPRALQPSAPAARGARAHPCAPPHRRHRPCAPIRATRSACRCVNPAWPAAARVAARAWAGAQGLAECTLEGVRRGGGCRQRHLGSRCPCVRPLGSCWVRAMASRGGHQRDDWSAQGQQAGGAVAHMGRG